MLGTASPWLGQSLVVFDVVFLVVSLPSIVNVRLGFQDLVFGVYAIFHSSRTAPKFADFVLSLFPSLFSHLVTASHLWWFSLSPCLSFEVWIMFSFVYTMWGWKVVSGLKFSL
ncbi:hypothetical protein F2Q68_00044710 [Brassica cretica]|uniref:Uncharacterized protein n=1 Tax=Brassica cretica TaxID=69181 RepID=A0A8S9LSU6_BRACR|nr:hypothetical protein F2Q68_00044710 [Brassica cretica]